MATPLTAAICGGIHRFLRRAWAARYLSRVGTADHRSTGSSSWGAGSSLALTEAPANHKTETTDLRVIARNGYSGRRPIGRTRIAPYGCPAFSPYSRLAVKPSYGVAAWIAVGCGTRFALNRSRTVCGAYTPTRSRTCGFRHDFSWELRHWCWP